MGVSEDVCVHARVVDVCVPVQALTCDRSIVQAAVHGTSTYLVSVDQHIQYLHSAMGRTTYV